MSDLAKRIGEESGQEDQVESLELPDTPEVQIPNEQPTEQFDAETISLYNWYMTQCNNNPFENIQLINFSVRGTIPGQYMAFKIPRPDLGYVEHGFPRVQVVMFEGADHYVVLNLPGEEFNVYHNNTSRIIYNIGEERFIKCYCVKTGLKLFYCLEHDGIKIPYKYKRVKKDAKGTNFYFEELQNIQERILRPLDIEALQIRYKQIQKYLPKIRTRVDALKFFQDRQKEVLDINHLIQIDEVMMSINE